MDSSLASRIADSSQPPIVVAELSGNHNGNRGRFLDLIRAAAQAGADAVKFQTYTADTMTLPIDSPDFRVSDDHPLWPGARLYDLYEQAHTPWEWHAEGFALARSLGIDAFSSPFDRTATDFLEDFDPPMYKIASLEVTDLPLIRYVASKSRPVVLSVGTADFAEIAEAVQAARDGGASEIVVLQCTSSYPADPADANLRTIPTLREALGVYVGLSDHTVGVGVSIAAVALGARLIEKHFTLNRTDGGVDSAFSLEPTELRVLVDGVRDAHLALGTSRIQPPAAEAESKRLRRSLYVAADVRAGDIVDDVVVRAVRPGGGLKPGLMPDLIGRRFAVDAVAGTAMSWDLLSPR
jgi:pseudaminic acid synthase